MREIKFRAWYVTDEEMIFPSAINFGIGAIYTDKEGKNYEVNWCSLKLMEFTGLKDKNGKEIYEGDIVAHKCFAFGPHVVEWEEDMFGFVPLSLDYDYDDEWKSIEVIGNIHENPELLK